MKRHYVVWWRVKVASLELDLYGNLGVLIPNLGSALAFRGSKQLLGHDLYSI